MVRLSNYDNDAREIIKRVLDNDETIIEDEIIPREQIVYYLHVKPEKLKKYIYEGTFEI